MAIAISDIRIARMKIVLTDRLVEHHLRHCVLFDVVHEVLVILQMRLLRRSSGRQILEILQWLMMKLESWVRVTCHRIVVTTRIPFP